MSGRPGQARIRTDPGERLATKLSWPFGGRDRSRRSGFGNRAGSRFAAPMTGYRSWSCRRTSGHREGAVRTAARVGSTQRSGRRAPRRFTADPRRRRNRVPVPRRTGGTTRCRGPSGAGSTPRRPRRRRRRTAAGRSDPVGGWTAGASPWCRAGRPARSRIRVPSAPRPHARSAMRATRPPSAAPAPPAPRTGSGGHCRLPRGDGRAEPVDKFAGISRSAEGAGIARAATETPGGAAGASPWAGVWIDGYGRRWSASEA
jgi:hypothetical protein